MFRYLVRRILWAILLFLIITFVTFVIFFMAPNDPARAQCGRLTEKRAPGLHPPYLTPSSVLRMSSPEPRRPLGPQTEQLAVLRSDHDAAVGDRR